MQRYYKIVTLEKEMLIKTAREEIEIVRRLIVSNVHKYRNIVKGAGEIDIYALDQACADIDKTIGYIRKIIIKIPSIVEKRNIAEMKKENKKILEKYREMSQTMKKLR